MQRITFPTAARLASALIVALASCKSGGSGAPDLGPSAASPELSIKGATALGGGAVFYRLDNSDGGITRRIRATPDEAWKSVLATYSGLKLPITSYDDQKHTISSTQTRTPRKLGGKPLRDYLDCGSGISGPRVDSYDVAYTLVTTVSPAEGDSTAVHSTLVASATNPSGTSGGPVDCATTGQLERRIAQLVALGAGR